MFFPVDLANLTVDCATLPGWKAVRRTDTGDILHVHSDSYKLVPNEEIYGAFNEAIEKASAIDTSGMLVHDDMSHGGARAFREYVFPAVTAKVGTDDALALRMVVFNSYDGTTAFRACAGHYRFVCANTAVIGKHLADFRRRHTAGFEIGDVAKIMAQAAETFIEESRRYEAWAERQISMGEAIDVIRAMPSMSDQLFGHLLQRIPTDDDLNLWGLYNTLTAWATHVDGDKLNARAVRDQRERRVAKVIDCPAWKQLEAA